jgi:zona occludens toxin (predicted ATPase)
MLIFTGKPRTGKSYRVVNDLLMDDVQDKYVIYHNIKGLRIDAFKWENRECVHELTELMGEGLAKDEAELFSYEFMKSLCMRIDDEFGKERKLLVVVDEAHLWFDKKRTSIKEWLTQHGHFGMDVWLIAQRNTMINKDYRALSEYEIRAKNDSFFNMPWFFLYAKYDTAGQFCGFGFRRKRKEVYEAYQSYFLPGHKKQISWIMPCILISLVLVPLYWWKTVGGIVGTKGEAQAKTIPAKSKPVEEKSVQVRTEPAQVSIPWWEEFSLSMYSGSGIGGQIKLQDKRGRILDVRVVRPEARVLGYEDGCGVIMERGRKYNICRKYLSVAAPVPLPERSVEHRAEARELLN